MENINQEELKKALEIEKKLNSNFITNLNLDEFNDKTCESISDQLHQWDEFFLSHDENDKIIISECKKINDYKFLVQITFTNGYNITTNICKPKDYNFYLLISDIGVYGGYLFNDKKSYLENEINTVSKYLEAYEILSDKDKKLLEKYTDIKYHIDYNKSIYTYYKNELKELS